MNSNPLILENQLTLYLYANEWLGLYLFLQRYNDTTLHDHPYALALHHYKQSINRASAGRWGTRNQSAKMRRQTYQHPLPWYLAVILWHEIQASPNICMNTQAFLSKLDQALVSAGFKSQHNTHDSNHSQLLS